MSDVEGWMEDHTSIRELNDRARSTLLGCRVMVTQGIQALNDIAAILHKVATFDTFTEDNDPHGEHDFGTLLHKGETIFWKFDYYDRSLTSGSENPADPEVTVRVLTLMLAWEY